jgi:hypothetical protein
LPMVWKYAENLPFFPNTARTVGSLGGLRQTSIHISVRTHTE